MSDTTTPSAAEVMGYRLDWPDGHSTFKVWVSADGAKMPPAWTPTPDDMLAFLRAGGFLLAYVSMHDDGCRLELISSPARDDGKVERDYEAPTLHAALEAAVIAVGRAE